MEFFLDTADVQAIKELMPSGMVDGITTNPSLVQRSGRDMADALRDICDMVDGPVSAEVVATDVEGMVSEGRKLAQIAPNIVIKVPLTWDGLQACRTLIGDNHRVNVTLCFSVAQALLAAKVGATYISPFIGRLDDIGLDGLELIAGICEVYENYGYDTKVLAASIRSPRQVADCARIGAHVATVPPAILHQLVRHPLTDKGLAAFLDDWKKTGQKI